MLVYTISDLRENSIKCIDLLYESLLYKNNDNFDFYVVTNNKDYKDINIYNKYNLIYDDIQSPYIGWLKYTEKLPDNYDNYFYFDSDILCYEDLNNLISTENDISIVKENKPMSNEWFQYPFASDDEKEKFKYINGINAGTYAFKSLDFIKEIRSKFESLDISSDNDHVYAMLEQSCFNYSVFNLLLSNKYTDITKYVRLFAKDDISEHTIYHFCGYEGFMDNKYVRMNRFNKNYNLK